MSTVLLALASTPRQLIDLAKEREIDIGIFRINGNTMTRAGVEVTFLEDRILYKVSVSGRKGQETTAGGFENHRGALVTGLLKLLNRNRNWGP